MFRILPETDGNLIAVAALGKLTDADYTTFLPLVEAVIATHGKLHLYADLTEFEGWEWQAAYDDIAFGVKHWGDFERMAIVGDNRWEKLAATIIDKLSQADVKFFAADLRDDAMNWVRGDSR